MWGPGRIGGRRGSQDPKSVAAPQASNSCRCTLTRCRLQGISPTSPPCTTDAWFLQDSHGVLAAREFVWWYNAHPDARHLPIDLSKVKSVAVCGIGNVALDCARVLLRPLSQLAPTDIAGHAMQQLARSRVLRVHLFARRGPVQVMMRGWH